MNHWKHHWKSHRSRCFGAAWPYRYAYGMAYVQTEPDCATEPEAGPSRGYEQREHRRSSRHGGHRAGSFGVRRPLRYLSYQLDLDESQRRTIAAVLDSMKTEREQAALDEKKMVANLADLVAEPEVTKEALADALSARVRSAEQVQAHIASALTDILAALDPDQREEFSYLVRTGAFRI